MLEPIAWLILAAGTVTIVVARASKSRYRLQESWKEVPGVVASSEVKRTDELYVPEVCYTYSVSEEEFVGDTVRSGLICHNWSGPAEKICARYAAGTPVSVYVNPSNPANAVLERGGDRGFGPVLYAVATLLILVASAMLASA
jgi:hypothetical protein